MGLIKITPDEEKANSMLKMAVITLKMIETIDKTKFPSNIVKEYYDVIRELMSSILLLDGYKLIGENAHKNLIDYIKSNGYLLYADTNINSIFVLKEIWER